jgi:hypothetical protein
MHLAQRRLDPAMMMLNDEHMPHPHLFHGSSAAGAQTTLEQAQLDPLKILEEMDELVRSESGASGSGAGSASAVEAGGGIEGGGGGGGVDVDLDMDKDDDRKVPGEWTPDMQQRLMAFLSAC